MKKRIFFNGTTIYFLSSILNSGISFFLLPILIKFYSVEEYGVYSIIFLTTTILGGFFYLGSSSAYSRFYFSKRKSYRNSKLLIKVLKLSIYGGLILSLLLFFLGGDLSIYLFENEKYKSHLFLSGISISLNFIVSIALVDLQFKNKEKLYLIVSIIGTILNFATTYFSLTKLKLGIYSPIFGTLISNFTVAFIFILLNLKLLIRNFKTKIDKEIFLFGLNAAFLGILIYLIDYSDRYVINNLLSLKEVGIYSLGYKIGMVVNVLFITPFSLSWAPLRLKYLDDENQLNFTRIIVNLYFYISSLLILISVFFSKPIFKILFKNPDYYEAIYIIPLIIYSLLVFGLTNVTNLGLYVKNKLWIQNIIYFISILVNVFLNLILVPKFGIKAAAISTLITFLFITFFVTKISNKFIYLSFDKKVICLNILFSGVLLFSIEYSQNLSSIIKLFLIAGQSYLIVREFKRLEKTSIL